MNEINPAILRKREISEIRSALDREEAEIDAALAILQRYTGSKPQGVVVNKLLADDKPTVPRPDGVPVLWEMVVAALTPHTQHGGLKSGQIVDFIGEKYWPGVQGKQIIPSLYRFLNEGRLSRKDNKFNIRPYPATK